MAIRKTADPWFAEYGGSHQNDASELIQWICVPVIFGCVLGLVWSAPVPAALAGAAPWFNRTLPVALAGLLFYLRLPVPLAIGMFVFIGARYALIEWCAAAFRATLSPRAATPRARGRFSRTRPSSASRFS